MRIGLFLGIHGLYYIRLLRVYIIMMSLKSTAKELTKQALDLLNGIIRYIKENYL